MVAARIDNIEIPLDGQTNTAPAKALQLQMSGEERRAAWSARPIADTDSGRLIGRRQGRWGEIYRRKENKSRRWRGEDDGMRQAEAAVVRFRGGRLGILVTLRIALGVGDGGTAEYAPQCRGRSIAHQRG